MDLTIKALYEDNPEAYLEYLIDNRYTQISGGSKIIELSEDVNWLTPENKYAYSIRGISLTRTEQANIRSCIKSLLELFHKLFQIKLPSYEITEGVITHEVHINLTEAQLLLIIDDRYMGNRLPLISDIIDKLLLELWLQVQETLTVSEQAKFRLSIISKYHCVSYLGALL